MFLEKFAPTKFLCYFSLKVGAQVTAVYFMVSYKLVENDSLVDRTLSSYRMSRIVFSLKTSIIECFGIVCSVAILTLKEN